MTSQAVERKSIRMGVCGQLSDEWVKGKLNVTTDGVMLDGVSFIR